MEYRMLETEEIGALRTDRIAAMEALTRSLNDAGVRKTELFLNIAESLKQTVGEPRETRRAKAFAHHLAKIQKPIYDGEQLIGSITGMCPVDPTVPGLDERREEAIRVLDEHFARKRAGIEQEKKKRGVSFDDGFTGGPSRYALMARDHYEANIRYLDLQTLIDEMKARYADEPGVQPGEIGKVLEVYFNYDYGDEARDLMRELPWNVANHTCLDYPRLVKIGYDGVRAEVRAALHKHPEREVFYNAMLLSLDAASGYIHDYAAAAREAAKSAKIERAGELNELARVCDKIADQKPDTFFEAIQLVWMTHLIGNVGGGSAMSIGRFDQYMRPFFEKDYADGTLSLDRARELIAALWLKLNEPKMRTVQSCCLGGVTREGKDGASLLTRLCLEVTALLKLPYPNTSVRVNDEISPGWLLDECIRTIKAGGGMPMILNDRLWVKNFHETVRLPIEDARDFYNMGCVEMLIQSKQPNWAGGAGVNLPQLVLQEIEKKKDAPGTFDEFMDDIVDEIHKKLRGHADEIHQRVSSEKDSCDPFASALVEGCIASGRDFFNGGTALGPFVSFGCSGLGTATDSLLAIRKHVYEDGDLTLVL